jgi:uncharacterized protein YlxW (UPF0749 family)
MNTSSYPSSSTPSQGPSKDNRGLIYGILIAALLGTWGYIIYDKSRTKEVFEQKDQQYASLDSSKTSIQKEYEEALLRLDGMTSTNASLDSLVKTKDSELAGLKGRISTLVKKKIDGYLQEIERLQGENQQLTEDKRNLSNEKSRLEGDLSSTRSEKKAADDLIDIGSTLSASNFQIAAVDVKGSGKEKSTNTAKKADKFRISFDLAENRIAQSGSKELYVVVMDPAGKVVQEQGLGSGTFRTREDGDRQYTNKVSVNYSQGERKNVSFDLQQADKYVPGNYKVDVYHNGFRIGGGTVNLKKAGLFN